MDDRGRTLLGGNLTNTDELLAGLGGRMMKTTSDSEALLNVFAEDINVEYQKSPDADSDKMIFDAAGCYVHSHTTPHV